MANPDPAVASKLHVKSIQRRNIKGWDEFTIEASSFLSIRIELLKAQIEAGAEMAALLREVEWSGRYSDGHGDLYSECPVCGAEPSYGDQPSAHEPTCRLGNMLARLAPAGQ